MTRPTPRAIPIGCVVATLSSLWVEAASVRLKDLGHVEGMRPNHLMGLGLVTGLAGTGDNGQSLATQGAVATFLRHLHLTVPSPETLAVQNYATVVVTAELPPFAKMGGRIDIKVVTAATATSLAGGVLLRTQLEGIDGNVYALAEGPLSLPSPPAAKPQVLTQATLSAGAILERDYIPGFVHQGRIRYSLHEADFTSASRAVSAINRRFKAFLATATNPREILVSIPSHYASDPIYFVSELEQVRIHPDIDARVVINERSGTVVMGADVVLSPVTVAHGDLTLQVEGQPSASGATDQLVHLSPNNVQDLVDALNSLGASPADLAAILSAVAKAGALGGTLKLI